MNMRDISSDAAAMAETVTVIEPRSGWRLIDWKELGEYRDLFFFLTWRHIKVRYAQSAIGIGWAIVQPLFYMLVFTVVFGRLARIESDGAPYADESAPRARTSEADLREIHHGNQDWPVRPSVEVVVPDRFRAQ